MERVQKAKDLFLQGYNCAQSVAIALADTVGMSEEDMKALSNPFGGGFCRLREVCGAVSGMLMILGLKHKEMDKLAMYKLGQQAIKEFEDNLLLDKPESFWQDWFSKNKWVLGSEYLQIIDERHINVDNIADYLMEAFDGFVDIVEIKKPGIDKLWCDTLDHGNYIPTSELTKAIIQCQNYIYEIERQSNSIDFLERVKNNKVIKPRCLLVFGRSNLWNNEQRKAYRILNASLNQITILTYDHLLERIKNIYSEEKATDDFDDLPF